MKAKLALADGRIFKGESFGASGQTEGEVVFNTSMMGYQEVLTDPSYRGQMVAMTYPLIGNYGINPEDFESEKPHLSALIIKELSSVPSSWRSTQTLDEFLKKYNIMGIQGIDTRALTIHIREVGAQQAVLSTKSISDDELFQLAKQSPSIVGRDLVKEVTCSKPYVWEEGEWDVASGYANVNSEKQANPLNIIAYDLGIKRNILRKFNSLGCKVKVVPASTSSEEVLNEKPDGVFISNGPGDPEGVPYVIKTVSELIGKTPIFGICLGHQIINLALGGKTFKLRFGHHGGNQPVLDMNTKKVEITSQNHCFAVASPPTNEDFEVTSINLNDQTVEGIRHKKLPVFSVQYHPEASPGPHDSSHLFEEFIQSLKKNHASR
jgi:carbamoyl-phosphate synthase small subunit